MLIYLLYCLLKLVISSLDQKFNLIEILDRYSNSQGIQLNLGINAKSYTFGFDMSLN